LQSLRQSDFVSVTAVLVITSAIAILELN